MAEQEETRPYSEADIVVLRGLEPIRKRPGMYIGAIGDEGIASMLTLALDEPGLEAQRRHASLIAVHLTADEAEVFDDGRPFPGPALNLFMMFPAGSSGTCDCKHRDGHELVILNALSTHFQLDVWNEEGQQWRIIASRGVIVRDAEQVLPAEPIPHGAKRGTRLRFRPDREVLKSTNPLPFEHVAQRLRVLAGLNPGLHTQLTDEHERRREHHFSGLGEYLLALKPGAGLPLQPLVFESAWKEVRFQIALRWLRDTNEPEQIVSFANNAPTVSGSHVEGLRRAVLHAVRTQAKAMGVPSERVLLRRAVFGGMHALIAVNSDSRHLPFAGPTRQVLALEGLEGTVAKQLKAALLERFRIDAAFADALVGRALRAASR